MQFFPFVLRGGLQGTECYLILLHHPPCAFRRATLSLIPRNPRGNPSESLETPRYSPAATATFYVFTLSRLNEVPNWKGWIHTYPMCAQVLNWLWQLPVLCFAIVFAAGRRAGGHYATIFICIMCTAATAFATATGSGSCNWIRIQIQFRIGNVKYFNATWDLEQYANVIKSRQELGCIIQTSWQKMSHIKRKTILE